MRDASWYRGFRTASIQVDCNGLEHRVTWRRGKVILEDHDISSEQALQALGGEPAPCLEFMNAWKLALGNPALLRGLLSTDSWSRNPDRWSFALPKMTAPTGLARTVAASTGKSAQQIVASLRRSAIQTHRREALFSLAGSMRRRLLASILAGFAKEGDVEGSVGWAFDQILERRVMEAMEPAVHHWLPPGSQGRVSVFTHVEPLPWDADEAILLGQMSSTSLIEVAARLPASWLLEVWCREIEVVDGAFVSRVISTDDDGVSLNVLATRWDRHGGMMRPFTGEAMVHVGGDVSRLWFTED